LRPLLRVFLDRVVRQGTLEVERANGLRFVVGDGTAPRTAVRFSDPAAERRLILDPALAMGELWMDGRLLVTQGSIYDVLDLVSRNLKLLLPPGIGKARERWRRLVRRCGQVNTERRAKRNVAHHYDLSGMLYDLFLDPSRQYSCAYFESAGQSLEDAQRAKKRHIAAKLLLHPGQRVLDIGCGWGGLGLYLAESCDVSVTGVTLSEEQWRVAVRRAHERAMSRRAVFELQDYRKVSGAFDRIVSVGMFEHVGVNDYDTFFRKAAQLLKEDGVMLLHSIGRVDGPGATNPWIAKYIFPGGYTPALSEVLPAIERAGLVVADIEILRLHYAATLKAWRERFLARRGDALALYDERFCRMWEFYLAAAECGFRHCGLMAFQIQLARQQEAVPLTRDYIAERERALSARETARRILHPRAVDEMEAQRCGTN
jgi:cyclopropane-fatty-acyl-phospholipid synthase